MRPFLFQIADELVLALNEEVKFDEARQISILPGSGTPAVSSHLPLVTKKADRERGEDQKDRWC